MTMTAGELAEQIGAELQGDADVVIHGVMPVDQAGPGDLAFVANPKYLKYLKDTRASAIILSPKHVSHADKHLNLLVCKDAYFAFRIALILLYSDPQEQGTRLKRAAATPVGISPHAVIDASAVIGEGCSIGPFVVVGRGAKIGPRTILHPHVCIGPDARVGADCELFPSVTLYDQCVLGDRVTLHAGCVIGEDGFGYVTAKAPGEEETRHHKIPAVGIVVIEDDVEMGANCCIDRATIGQTVVKQGSKFSNSITIGHGAEIGEHNLIVAQVGVAGSSQTGRYVAIGGQAGIAGHLEIGDGARVAAQSGVMSDVPAGEDYGGLPAQRLSDAKRTFLYVQKVPDLLTRIKQLEKRLKELEVAEERKA